MGGSAFHSLLGEKAFPRIPPGVYQALKARLYPIISTQYRRVATPIEAPEKVDYGDLDLLVTEPLPDPTTRAEREAVPHDIIKSILGAKHAIPMEGNRTSNYAIPVRHGEWRQFGHAEEEDLARNAAPNSEIFYQVDVHVCQDDKELDRVQFFHSYGDMGMLLGLVARNVGLKLGVGGLKVPRANQPPFHLCDSFDEILAFLRLDQDVYRSGFETKQAVFDWVASMRFFDPRIFRHRGIGFTKVKPERSMYHEFVRWVEGKRNNSDPSQFVSAALDPDAISAQAQHEALQHFNLTSQYKEAQDSHNAHARLRNTFCGYKVRDWAQMGGYWKGVKLIMDAVRSELGGEEGVLHFLDGNGEQALQELVVQVRNRLGLIPFMPGCDLKTGQHLGE